MTDGALEAVVRDEHQDVVRCLRGRGENLLDPYGLYQQWFMA